MSSAQGPRPGAGIPIGGLTTGVSHVVWGELRHTLTGWRTAMGTERPRKCVARSSLPLDVRTSPAYSRVGSPLRGPRPRGSKLFPALHFKKHFFLPNFRRRGQKRWKQSSRQTGRRLGGRKGDRGEGAGEREHSTLPTPSRGGGGKCP